MAIKSIDEMAERDIEIDLTGPEGNVFCLMGKALRFAKDLGLDGEAIVADMQSADYEHAVAVMRAARNAARACLPRRSVRLRPVRLNGSRAACLRSTLGTT